MKQILLGLAASLVAIGIATPVANADDCWRGAYSPYGASAVSPYGHLGHYAPGYAGWRTVPGYAGGGYGYAGVYDSSSYGSVYVQPGSVGTVMAPTTYTTDSVGVGAGVGVGNVGVGAGASAGASGAGVGANIGPLGAGVGVGSTSSGYVAPYSGGTYYYPPSYAYPSYSYPSTYYTSSGYYYPSYYNGYYYDPRYRGGLFGRGGFLGTGLFR